MAIGRAATAAVSSAPSSPPPVGYFGCLIGPLLLGFVAQATALMWGLALVARCTTIIAFLADGAGRADRTG